MPRPMLLLASFLAFSTGSIPIAAAQENASTRQSFPKGAAYQLTIDGVSITTCFWKDIQRALTTAAQTPTGIASARLVTLPTTDPKARECKASYEAYLARGKRNPRK